jgi:hypothetical protein
MALLDLNIRELCDPRTKTYGTAGFAAVLKADPAVTVPLLAKLDEGQFKHTPYWRVCVLAAAQRNHSRCALCGGGIRHGLAVPVVPPGLVHGTEHLHLDKFKVTHGNQFACMAYSGKSREELRKAWAV